MRTVRKILALLLGLVLLLPLLSAGTSAAQSDLRAVAVAQAEAIANVPYTLGTRISKFDVTGYRLDHYNANGIFPTTYFEYKRLHFPLRGVIVESNLATLEQFEAQADPSQTIVPGFPHIPGTEGYVGMDVNAFLTDVISRVSPAKVTSLRQALTDESLEALLPGADLSAASSLAAIGSRDAKAAYASLQSGDLLLAWDDNADVTVDPKISALVVKSVDAAKGEVTVIYPSFNLLLWHFKCDACGKEETEGPTSAVVPEHVTSTESLAFGSFKTHRETERGTSCTGTWQPVYASTWRTAAVSFDQLAGAGGQKVPDASKGYLPYTLDVYSTGAPEPKVTATAVASATAEGGGTKILISSNYRIVSVDAALTGSNGTAQHFTHLGNWDSWTYEFTDPELDFAMLQCEPGEYTLTLDVCTGAATDPVTRKAPVVRAYTQNFTLAQASLKMALNKSFLHQGQAVGAVLTTLEEGFTAGSASLHYDPEFYVFDAAASKAASPGASFAEAGSDTISVTWSGSALGKGATMATPVFNARRTGHNVTAAAETGPFYLTGFSASKTAGAGTGSLTPYRPDTTAQRAGIGMNAVIYPNYAGGNDLILAFMCTPEMTASTSSSAIAMTYDGQPMYDVSAAHYQVDGDSFVHIYAYIAPGASADKLAVGTQACPVLPCDGDVNRNGWVDLADAQAMANIRSGKLPLAGNMAKWLQADFDRSGTLDRDDQLALMSALMK